MRNHQANHDPSHEPPHERPEPEGEGSKIGGGRGQAFAALFFSIMLHPCETPQRMAARTISAKGEASWLAASVAAPESITPFEARTRPAPDLCPEERDEVKKVARELLARLKELLVINWRQKSSARSQLRLAIEDMLDTGLPRAYSPELYQQKCAAVFEHVYESYPERNVGVYAEAG